MKHSLFNEYADNGYFFIRKMFGSETISEINKNLDSYLVSVTTGVSYEDNGALRAVHGIHLYSDYFSELSRNDTFREISHELLNGEPYIHQSKVNLKMAINGKAWPWHQDFTFWNKLDHIPTPNMLSIAILLDDVDYLAGPLWFVPKSHIIGDLSEVLPGLDSKAHSWESDVSEELSYQIPEEAAKNLQLKHGSIPFVGKSGDVVVFHSRLVHGSTNNLSPKDRRLLIFTYNEINNIGIERSKRPEFLCSNP